MPKLDTTIDNLERKSNKVIGTTPSANWTDAQYPSAKTLYSTYTTLLDLMHPVDSILTTATNTNPSATLGGTWELVDKEFRVNQLKLDSSYWTNTNATLLTGGSTDDDASICSWTGHSIFIRLGIYPTIELTDATLSMGKLNLPALGITSLPYSTRFGVTSSDAGNCYINYSFLRDTGELIVFDAINVDGAHSMTVGTERYFYVHIQEEIPYTLMNDDFCDKFYWKRTA